MHFFSIFDLLMEQNEAIINFEGSISFETMEQLLNQLKSARQFNALRKPAKKRVYGTVVETIDNIFKYATPFKGKDPPLRRPPRIQVRKYGGKFIVSATSSYQWDGDVVKDVWEIVQEDLPPEEDELEEDVDGNTDGIN